ncbi:MAG: pyridoxal-phosphate dependent enzyme [Theionarchaea archaeon]|nr:pyridoxal-phosphate dependent enzyme [Theionarchaea archaeon]
MYETHLKCLKCGTEYELMRMFEGCPHCRKEDFSSNVYVDYDYEKIKEAMSKTTLERRRGLGIWKYEELLPVTSKEGVITLGEGETPLLECNTLSKKLKISPLFAKDESRNPTHTFKDRSAAVGAAVAKKFGSNHLIAGGGNTAAAAAAYGARSHLQVISFENVDESGQAILQTLSYGGKVIYLNQYEARYNLMKKCVDTLHAHPVSSYTPSPTGDPYSEEGRKTVAYEICEQLHWEVPDMVIVPTGMGFGLYGIWRGFCDFHTLGLTDSVPKMVAVESAAGGSLTKAFLNKDEKIKRVVPQETVARHILVPKVSYQGYRAVKDSNGKVLTVEDDEIMEAVFSLARTEGIYASTTSAAAVAAARNLRATGYIDKNDTVVCVITGGGVKDPDFIEKEVPHTPDPIGDDWEIFKSVMKKYYNVLL